MNETPILSMTDADAKRAAIQGLAIKMNVIIQVLFVLLYAGLVLLGFREALWQEIDQFIPFTSQIDLRNPTLLFDQMTNIYVAVATIGLVGTMLIVFPSGLFGLLSGAFMGVFLSRQVRWQVKGSAFWAYALVVSGIPTVVRFQMFSSSFLEQWNEGIDLGVWLLVIGPLVVAFLGLLVASYYLNQKMPPRAVSLVESA